MIFQRATFRDGKTYYTIDKYLYRGYGLSPLTLRHLVVEKIVNGFCIERHEIRPGYNKRLISAFREARKFCRGAKVNHIKT